LPIGLISAADRLRLASPRLRLSFRRNLKNVGWQFGASILYLFDERGQSWGHFLIDAIVISHKLSEPLPGESPAMGLIS
jgi:hypothetical protein